MIEVKFKKFEHDARVPEYAHDTDSGADLRWFGAVECWGELHRVSGWSLNPGHTAKFWMGIGVRLPEGYELQIRPRSSMSAKGIATAWGTCDEAYTGQIAVVLTNLTNRAVVFQRGDKLAQAVIAKRAPQMSFVEVDDLGETSRGDRGFGSSGVR